jgi:hypothetical protein
MRIPDRGGTSCDGRDLCASLRFVGKEGSDRGRQPGQGRQAMQATPALESTKIGGVGAAGRRSVLRLGEGLRRFGLLPEALRSV